MQPPRLQPAPLPPSLTRLAPILLLLLLALLPGCSAFNDHRDYLRDLYAQGNFDQAAALLDSSDVQKLYGRNEGLLYLLDRGSVALAQHDHDRALELFERAEAQMEARTELSAGDEITQWLLNDTARPYLGEPYESIYINVMKALAQLERGAIIGGATVEARRMATKANTLRDRYLKYEEAVLDEGGAGFQQALRRSGGGMVTTNGAGEFVESTLGTFLTAVTFMHSGEPANQEVAARRLIDSIRLQRGLVGPIDPAAFEGLGERPPQPGDVLIVALSGRGPTKRAERFGPIPIFDWPVYFEIPVLEGGGSQVTSSRVIVEPLDAPSPSSPQALGDAPISRPPTSPPSAPAINNPQNLADVIPLTLVEDMAAVAKENHRRQLPLIYTRAILRSSLKAGASFAATQAIRSSDHRDNDLAALGSVLAGLAFVALTERADLRAWVFLPGQAHVGLFNLPPGDYRLRIEYLAPGGRVLHAGDWRPLSIPPYPRGEGENLTTLVEHFWR